MMGYDGPLLVRYMNETAGFITQLYLNNRINYKYKHYSFNILEKTQILPKGYGITGLMLRIIYAKFLAYEMKEPVHYQKMFTEPPPNIGS